MKDQYDEDIPEDLVPLSWYYLADIPEEYRQAFIQAVDYAPWYEVERNTLSPHSRPVLAISWSVISDWQDNYGVLFDPVELDEAGIYGALSTHLVYRVDRVLHRHSAEGGFWHA